MNVQDIVWQLEIIAPPELALNSEREGLQLGHPYSDVGKIAVALSPSPFILSRCAEEGIGLLVVHRQLFTEPVCKLVGDTPGNEAVLKAASAGVAVYSMGSSFDASIGGPTDALADLLGFQCQDTPLITRLVRGMFKIVVFTPPEALDAVRDAMSDAGAGHVGNYSDCSFAAEGTGTFLPLPGTNPYSGEGIGELAHEKEYRLEMIIPEENLEPVVVSMLEAHPYEEVAYDIIPILNQGRVEGAGRVCDLAEPITLPDVESLLKEKLGTDGLRISAGGSGYISRIALFAGEGIEYVEPAANMGANLIITGDLGIAGFCDAERLGIAAIDVPVRDIMKPGVKSLYINLQETFADEGIDVIYLD